MKRILALLVCLLLCGCARDIPETTAPTETFPTTAATTPEGLYQPESALEQRWQGALRVYPLNREDAQGMIVFADGLLVFSGEETTALTLLSGEDLYIVATLDLDFLLSSGDPSLAICGNTLSFYDPVAKETVVLDSMLKPVSRIAAPSDLIGSPVLAPDRTCLYYCTRNGLCQWDLESGIRRTVKEMSYPQQTVCGIHQGGNIIHCRTADAHLFLSSETGALVRQWNEDISLVTTQDTFCAAFQLGLNPVLVYGSNQDASILLPETFTGEYVLFPDHPGAVRVTTPGECEVCLEYYDLTSGLRSSILTLESERTPADIAYLDGFVYILTYDEEYASSAVYRWDLNALAANDTTSFAKPYAIGNAPQKALMDPCQALAEELSLTHGIEILIGEAATAVQPWDYDLEPEVQPALILRELQLLQQRLAHYPQGMLADTAADFSSLKLCLVRSVTGTAESGSLSAATGVQFLEGTDTYVAITVGKYAQQALYHELFHVMETHIFNNSIAFDQWDTLNPSGFTYSYGHAANESRDSGIYLQSDLRAFIDAYSMSFPKEDRARVMEYAMLPGQEALFEAPVLQAKLQALCAGIREAYGLENAEETFLWEQYLN